MGINLQDERERERELEGERERELEGERERARGRARGRERERDGVCGDLCVSSRSDRLQNLLEAVGLLKAVPP